MSTCSPASSSSYDSNKTCFDRPSTTDATFNKVSTSSPAMARSVPSSHEATSPPEAASRDFVFFSTDMANRAVLDMEREKGVFDSLCDWYYKRGKAQEEEAARRMCSASGGPQSVGSLTQERQPSSVASLTNAGGDHNSGFNTPTFAFSPAEVKPTVKNGWMVENGDVTERTGVKRKMSEDTDDGPDLKMPRATSTDGAGPKEENPLRKMEMMTNLQQFSSSVADAAKPAAKKDERTAKLEKLDDIGKQVQVEGEMLKREEYAMAQQQMKQRMPQGSAPAYVSPHYPMPNMFNGNPGMMRNGGYAMGPAGPMPGPFSAGAYPHGYPGGPCPPGGMPMHPGQFPPHFFNHSMPPGYPMAAPGGKMPYPTPGYAMNGMHPAARMGGQMPPHMMQFYAHMQQMKGMSPGPPPHMMQMGAAAGPAGSANQKSPSAPMPFHPHGMPPFPAMSHPGYHPMMMMNMGNNGMVQPPYPYPAGMTPASMANQMQQHMHQQNGRMNGADPGMLMVMRDGSAPPEAAANGWAPQLTPCFPPGFSQPTPTPTASGPPSEMPTPSKMS